MEMFYFEMVCLTPLLSFLRENVWFLSQDDLNFRFPQSKFEKYIKYEMENNGNKIQSRAKRMSLEDPSFTIPITNAALTRLNTLHFLSSKYFLKQDSIFFSTSSPHCTVSMFFIVSPRHLPRTTASSKVEHAPTMNGPNCTEN